MVTQKTFTLLELMIVMAIMGILLVMAIPSYQNYTRRAHYVEIVENASPYKIGVEVCYEQTGELSACNGGHNGVPPDKLHQNHHLIHIIRTEGGIITLIPNSQYGITEDDTYQLIPTLESDTLQWQTAGGAVEKGYVN